jgi:hypothetical protein
MALLATVVSCTGKDDAARFEATVAYDDTVAIVGGVEEANPLFLYRSIYAALLDDSTVVNAERGRLVVARMTSGIGWEIESPAGAQGPGEFDGEQPKIFPYRGALFTITQSGAYNVFSATGSLISSARVPPSWWYEDEWPRIAGLAGDRIVIVYSENFDPAGPSQQALRQGIRIYDLAGELVADVDVPGLVRRIVAQDGDRGSTRTEIIEGTMLLAEARGDYIAYLVDNTLSTLDPDGSRIVSRELTWYARAIRLDAAGRVWVHVLDVERARTGAAPITVVFDRELNELFRIAERRAISASANAILTMLPDSFDTDRLVLLRRSGNAPVTNGR